MEYCMCFYACNPISKGGIKLTFILTKTKFGNLYSLLLNLLYITSFKCNNCVELHVHVCECVLYVIEIVVATFLQVCMSPSHAISVSLFSSPS